MDEETNVETQAVRPNVSVEGLPVTYMFDLSLFPNF